MNVNKAELYECISSTIELPSNHKMRMCGVYHPPKTTYLENNLIEYLLEIFDVSLEENPEGLVVCGGDLNLLDLEKLSALSGLNALVDFPTRKQAVLDNCLTNIPGLFSKCYALTFKLKQTIKV